MKPFKSLLAPPLVLALGLLLAGGDPASAEAKQTDQDWPAVAQAIHTLIREHVFDPALLESPAYATADRELRAAAARASTRAEFTSEFNRIWRQGPFSHVSLTTTSASAAQMARHLDDLKVGPQAVALSWAGGAAVLTVNTMMGSDTVQAITQAYQDIQARQAQALVIDLRRNPGGAFAVVPLVGHLMTAPYDAGFFVARSWTSAHAAPPEPSVVQQLPPWQGWSLRRFWDDVQREGVMRIQFAPMAPVFRGPVWVLTSAQTASAAEMAAEALQHSGRATVVGEVTAGKMLSQKMFDLPHGLLLSLPVADYWSAGQGRIEGQGVVPQVRVEAAQAMAVALKLAQDEAARRRPSP